MSTAILPLGGGGPAQLVERLVRVLLMSRDTEYPLEPLPHFVGPLP